MQIRRVHTVNSANDAIPFAFLNRNGRCFLLAMFAFTTPLLAQSFATPLLAQSAVEPPYSGIPTYPNPFRADAFATERGSPNGLTVDVIQLASLPSHVESPVVTAISVSSDGERIAAAGDDHAIRIVDLKSGKTTATLTGHLDWVQAVEFSPNGLHLASCGNDGTLRVWALGDVPKLLSTKTAPHALMTLTYINDDCIYAAGFSNRIYRQDVGQPNLMVVHACDCRDIRSIVASPDRKWIAFGGRDGMLRLRRVDLGDPEKSNHLDGIDEFAIPLHSDRIRSLEFSQDGKQIVSVGEDRRIVHYDLVSRKILLQSKIDGGKLLGLCQLEPHLFAVGSSDNTIRIFNDNDNDEHIQGRLVGHDGSVGILRRNKQFLISGSFDTTIRIWDISRAIASMDHQGKYVHPVAAQFEDSGAGADVK